MNRIIYSMTRGKSELSVAAGASSAWKKEERVVLSDGCRMRRLKIKEKWA
jgi:hypothetical protein